jgi:prepilin-type N-terminal cleavage/methylation domain-containing protein
MSKKTKPSYSLFLPAGFRARNGYPGDPLSNEAGSFPPRRRLPLGSAKGFTLVEIIISCALLLILAAIAAPYFQALTASSQVKGAVQTVTSDLQLTKMRSISLSKRCRLLFLDSHSYKLQAYNSEAALWEDMANEIVRDFSSNSNPYYHEGVTITAPGGNEVVFQPWGSTATAALTVQNTERQGTITVTPTGKVCFQVTDV